VSVFHDTDPVERLQMKMVEPWIKPFGGAMLFQPAPEDFFYGKKQKNDEWSI